MAKGDYGKDNRNIAGAQRIVRIQENSQEIMPFHSGSRKKTLHWHPPLSGRNGTGASPCCAVMSQGAQSRQCILSIPVVGFRQTILLKYGLVADVFTQTHDKCIMTALECKSQTQLSHSSHISRQNKRQFDLMTHHV